MAQEHRDVDAIMPAAAGAPPAGGSINGGRVNLVRPQELHDITLVVNIRGEVIEIPLKGHLILQNRGSPPQDGGGDDDAAPGRAMGPGTATATDRRGAGDSVCSASLDSMRGWLLTVATLFVGMAFAAMLHPPDWFKTEWYRSSIRLPKKHGMHAAAPSPHAAEWYNYSKKQDQQDTTTPAEARRAYLYLFSNAVTFATALVMVLVLFQKTSTARRTLRAMKRMVWTLAVFLASSFALGTSNDWGITGFVWAVMAAYAILTLKVLAHKEFRLVEFFMPYGNHKETRSTDEPGSV